LIRVRSERRAQALGALALLLFGLLFRFQKLGPLDFWDLMAASLVLLNGLAFSDARFRSMIRADLQAGLIRKVLLGLASAAVLYAIFFVGNRVARAGLPFAGEGISAVYGFKAGASTWKIWLLLVFVIGPGEELFWRGYLQRRFSRQFGRMNGFAIATALYALVHLLSGNPMLVLAAVVCGVAWGLLYMQFESAVLNAVSHTAWDLVVFLVLPFGA
jgi:uncharacterized protein